MIKAFLLGFSPSGTDASVDVLLRDTNDIFDVSIAVPLTIGDSDTEAVIRAAAPGVVVSYLGGLGVTVDSTEWLVHEAGLAAAPLAAIVNATGGAITNLGTSYNLLSGVLGLANALNDANTAQNDLATKFNALVASHNDLLAKVRTLGLIST